MNLLQTFVPVRVVGKHNYRAYMTFAIMFVAILFFFWEVALTLRGGQPIDEYLPQYALNVCEIGSVPLTELVVDSVRGLFMTDSILTLILNMMFLWIFGPLVEQFLGYRRYLSLFIISGLGGYLVSAVLTGGDCGVIYGPNAAISGVIAAFIFLFPTREIESVLSAILLRRFTVPAFFFGFVYLAIQFLVEGDGPLSGTWAPVWDEIGGFFVGFLFIFIVTLFKPAPKADPFAHMDD